ncbi:YitT family protein [Chengkuizengella axinellae]|uniref:YitT family protein n=1 Tax=Chengkuizengella axinellae TaxID=3064388 RepID=A0ABT9J2R4_9BACL|nr:YitT family protein [Chengkuizengella sp. 2205SS18-9]MDP5275896.1 YitT family protein [Chengkuizengella sp. 2205SS18-9]
MQNNILNNRSRRKKPIIQYGSPMSQILEYLHLIIGSFIVAFSFNLLLNPNEIASGGVVGISTILYSLFNFEPAITQWLINIPLFLAGIVLLGKKFGIKTAVGSVIMPLFVLMTSDLTPPTNNLLLATIFGGIGIGLGLGIVFRGRGSTGGIDLAAQIIHKYTGLSLGLSLAILDGLVILTAGILISPEKAMYALIGLFVTSRTINAVQIGFSYSKVAYIITKETEEVQEAIINQLDRGLTKLSGYGGYTEEEKIVFMVVVGQTEVTKLKTLVRSIDPNAFIILSDTNEVLGEGFKLTP